MDNTPCEQFFRQPTHPLQRRYEALRAYFIEHRPLPEVARQYGYTHGSLRNLVGQFRAQCHTGDLPPFSPPRDTAGQPAAAPVEDHPARTSQPPQTAGKSA